NGGKLRIDPNASLTAVSTGTTGLTNLGTFIDSGTFVLAGHWVSSTGTFTADAASTVTFVTSLASQTISAPYAFGTIVASNTSTSGGLLFASSFTATNFRASGMTATSTLTFTANSTATITNLTLQGSSGKRIMVR